MQEPPKLNIDEEKIKAWLQKGARPSDTARAFLIGRGLLPKESAKKRPTKPTKAEAAAAAAKAAPSEGGAPVAAAAAAEGA
jgi:small subunit ribosomal protein S16